VSVTAQGQRHGGDSAQVRSKSWSLPEKRPVLIDKTYCDALRHYQGKLGEGTDD
jgi:hypothetical protein